MHNKMASKKTSEYRYATRLLALEKSKHPHSSKEVGHMKACKNLLKSDDWESSKFSLLPKNTSKKTIEKKSSSKDIRSKHTIPKNREKVVIVSKKSSSVRVVKSGSQRCMKGVQRSVSVKKVSYSTSVVLSSGDEDGSDDSDEDEEEDEEEEEDDYDDEFDDNDKGDSVEKPRVSSRKKGTVIKHTMAKIKTNYCNGKKQETKSNKSTKAKSDRNQRDKNTGKKKGGSIPRELRPRFPYSSAQEWPTARAHRMASLNAMAKVHVLYENECKPSGETEENYLLESLSEDSSSADIKMSAKELKSLSAKVKVSDRSSDSSKNSKASVEKKSKVVKRRRKRKFPADVEIIDTKLCKRMASLNAQAILAASYVHEKPKRKEKVKKTEDKAFASAGPDVDIKEIILESSCNLKILNSEKHESPMTSECNPQENMSPSEILEEDEKDSIKQKLQNSASNGDHGYPEARSSESRHLDNDSSSSSHASSAMSEVTNFTKVTKVQINTTKEMEIKEEQKAERQIERIVEKDDMAIIRMYHYQSNSASQSYSVRMETTYKPSSRNFGSPITAHQRSTSISTPHVMGAVMPTRQNYYNYQNRPGVLASQSYPVNRNMQPVMGMDPDMARQYGSSMFAMPHHYGGPQPPMPFPPNDYGYYQPAGPLIQPVQDQYMIHKPVPYHPQPHSQLHQTHPQAPTSMVCSNLGTSCYEGQHLQNTSQTQLNHADVLRSEPGSGCSSSPIQINSASSGHQKIHTETSRQCNVSQVQCPDVRSMMQTDTQKQHTSHDNGHSSNSGFFSRSQNLRNYQTPSFRSSHAHQGGDISSLKKLQTSFAQGIPNVQQSQQYSSQHHAMKLNVVPKVEVIQPQTSCFAIHENFNSTGSSLPTRKFGHISKNERRNKSLDKADRNCPIWKHPPVIDIDSDQEFRNTKTYIELDVPKACPREKIVVVDVDKEDMKEESSKKLKPVSLSQYSVLSGKNIGQPELIEIDCPKIMPSSSQNSKQTSVSSSTHSKEIPEITVIEMSKKKEPSALIRRAKLHGKQRTYRDSENRPLVPYSNGKKNMSETNTHMRQLSKFQPQVSLPRLVLPRTFDSKLAHGWYWEGKPVEKLVYITNDDPPFLRLCYPAIRHREGDCLRVGNCALLKSGTSRNDLPFIAKVTALWENPANGEMTMSLLWYYRPEHTEPGRKPYHQDNEVFASKHRDTNSVACIEDKCYVLTYGEYCRYRRHCRMLESTYRSPVSVVPPLDDYPRKESLPPSCISPDMVFFCCRVYDFRQKRILKNPA